jgi:putative endonuclease
MSREYFVYMMTNKSRMLYVGVTNNLIRLVREHKSKSKMSFTERYKMDKLIYFENTDDITVAIEREKQIKGWTRRKKVALIHTMNPLRDDLSFTLMPEKDWNELPPPRYSSLHSE